MELRQLQYFIAVAEEASFTRASKRVHISQSGISAQILQLERELGQPLFDRSAREVRLSKVGEAVLPFARKALEASSELRGCVDQMTGLVRGSVRVGMVSGCALAPMAELLARFSDKYPGIHVSLAEDSSENLTAGIEEGTFDLALVGSFGIPQLVHKAITMTEERLVAAVSAGNPIARSGSIELVSLARHPLVCLSKGTGIRAAFDRACADLGISPDVRFEVSALSMVAQLGLSGLALAILPASTAKAFAPDLIAMDIVEPTITSRLDLVWSERSARSTAATELARFASEQLETFTAG